MVYHTLSRGRDSRNFLGVLVPVPLANPFLVGAELQNNDYNDLYYKLILTIVMIVNDACTINVLTIVIDDEQLSLIA